MVCLKAIILLRETAVAWRPGSLASSSWYILSSNSLCSSRRSILSASICILCRSAYSMARTFESNPLQQRRLVGGITIPQTRPARAELVDDLSLDSAVRNILACAGEWNFRLRSVGTHATMPLPRPDLVTSVVTKRDGHGGSVLRMLLVKFKRSRKPNLGKPSDNRQQTGLKSLKTQAPSGGLFGIDQEVVTLRGLYGNSGIPDRPASGGSNPNSPVVCGL
jgi:hypothetical protein